MSVKVQINGKTVEFEKAPSPEDIDHVASQLGISAQSPKPQKDLLQKTGDVVNSIFPGKQIGNALGNSLYGIGSAIKNRSMEPIYNANTENNKNIGRVAGDVVQAGLTIGAPAVGSGPTALGRIGANAALGVGLGASNAVAQGQGTKDIIKSGAIGGVIGGGVSAAGEGINALAEHLPKWFAKAALPKMKDSASYKYLPNEAGGYSKTAQEDAAEYALKNTKGLSVNKMLNHSNTSVEGYGNQIKTILSHPEYKGNTGNGAQAFQDTLKKFPEAQLNDKILTRVLKFIGKENAGIVDKVREGTATLAEKNALRQTLDKATKKVFTDHPALTFNKEIAHAFADALRGEVQTVVPETAPIFNKFSKELTLNQALQKALNKKRIAGPLLAGAGGFAHSGVKGALEAIAIEEGLRSPVGKLLTGKAIQGATKFAAPVAKAALQGGKAPLIKSLTDSRK